jgi:O-antigen ligase
VSRVAKNSIHQEVEDVAEAGLLPADFAPPRQTMSVIFVVIAWSAILACCAAGNSLLGLKKALLIIAGARMEPVLGAASLHSADIAIVLTAFLVVAAAGYIHVSLGLAMVLALRPWLDGFTYPTDNFYFLWAALYLLGLWSVRQLRTPQPIRGKIPLALFCAFLGWCVISASASIQFDATYRELLHWAACGTTFFLAINATPHLTSRGLLLIGLFTGMAGQALFAYPHLWYVLPWLREYLQEDPRRLAQWFHGATEFTPELARRFNLNRAFASMVFPNALAALLILGIPAAFACAWNGIGALRKPLVAYGNPTTLWRWIAPWGIGLFAAVCVPLYLLGQLPLTYQLNARPWFGTAQNLIYFSVLGAAVASAVFLFVARRHGLLRAGAILAALSSTMLFPLMCGALWLTYSRGAMLSLILAVVICAVFFLWRRRNPLWIGEPLHSAVLFATVTLAISVASRQLPAQAQADPVPPQPVVTGDGMNITVQELANPGSMKLRLGYWRVAWDIGLDYPLTGVGLGNFRVAYGPYQFLGAGDVQNAHNALLQAQCEIGLPGLLVFLVFWAYFLIWGGKAIRATKQASSRRHRLGLYCGVLAFLLHSLLDIHFSHPSLVMYVMATAGLFISHTTPVGASGRCARMGALPLLLLAAFVCGAAFRPYLFDLATNGGRFVNVGKRSLSDARLNAAHYFLGDCAAWADSGKSTPSPTISAAEALTLLPDREILFTVGRVLALDPEGARMAPLAKDSALPPEAVFQIVRPWDARHHAVAGIETWVAELERLDRRFPYDPQSAYLISSVYKLLVEQTGAEPSDKKSRWLSTMIAWADEAVKRSPWHKDMYQARAWAYWCCGTHTQGAGSLHYFERALKDFERSTQLGHLEPRYYFSEATALAAIGNAYQRAGRGEEGTDYLKQSERVYQLGEELQEKRWSLGLQ